MRPVDCAQPHDLRVFAQTSVDRTFPGRKEVDNGGDYAEEECGRAYARAPEEWLRDGRPKGSFMSTGPTEVVYSVGVGKSKTSVSGAYTCYVVTS
ncbi:hypothetical protein QCN29_27670 [Streptomyces sp. HNM0663]|uniref:Ig-like domain-containing protein n=1 Tax=Streptomyces chengmaiensis TaxID=3040919 RepID=A0ABT6HUU5_9ACTN|nr:hypothetical protein [Streptomyces chengmaiensis]MDH2392489.1 hypothetical protein [Streptomyces chengmaiensis]